jgi:hypothetical protein
LQLLAKLLHLGQHARIAGVKARLLELRLLDLEHHAADDRDDRNHQRENRDEQCNRLFVHDSSCAVRLASRA